MLQPAVRDGLWVFICGEQGFRPVKKNCRTVNTPSIVQEHDLLYTVFTGRGKSVARSRRKGIDIPICRRAAE